MTVKQAHTVTSSPPVSFHSHTLSQFYFTVTSPFTVTLFLPVFISQSHPLLSLLFHTHNLTLSSCFYFTLTPSAAFFYFTLPPSAAIFISHSHPLLLFLFHSHTLSSCYLDWLADFLPISSEGFFKNQKQSLPSLTSCNLCFLLFSSTQTSPHYHCSHPPHL